MKEQEFKEAILDYVLEKLTHEKVEQFEQFLNANQQFQDEVDQFKAIYQVTVQSDLPEPTLNMDDQFHAFLSHEVESNRKINLFNFDFRSLFSLNHLF